MLHSAMKAFIAVIAYDRMSPHAALFTCRQRACSDSLEDLFNNTYLGKFTR